MIFACYAGCGKTTAAKMMDDVLDLELVPYKYKFPDDYDAEQYSETDKAICQYDMNWNYPTDYVDAVEKYMKEYKHILIPTDLRVIDELKDRVIDFITILPDYRQADMKEHYEKRYRDRGNGEEFVDIFIGMWDMWMKNICEVSTRMEYLDREQYVADVIRKY